MMDDDDDLFADDIVLEAEDVQPVEYVRILRQWKSQWEVLRNDGRTVWCESDGLGEKKESLLKEFKKAEPVRKKLRRDTRRAEKERIEISDTILKDAEAKLLMRCYLWEIGRAFKTFFTTGRFRYTAKIFLTVNYDAKLNLQLLERAAVLRFAPPIQQLRLSIDKAIRHLDHDVRDLIYIFLGLPIRMKWPWKLELGSPERVKKDSLEMKMPRNSEDNLFRKYFPMLKGADLTRLKDQHDTWWFHLDRKDDCLARSILKSELFLKHADTTQKDRIRSLLKIENAINPKEAHSLELVIRYAGSIIATLIVPSDASLSMLEHWIRTRVARNITHRSPYIQMPNGDCIVTIDSPRFLFDQSKDKLNYAKIIIPLDKAIQRDLNNSMSPANTQATSSFRSIQVNCNLPHLSWTRCEPVLGSRDNLIDFLRDKALPEYLPVSDIDTMRIVRNYPPELAHLTKYVYSDEMYYTPTEDYREGLHFLKPRIDGNLLQLCVNCAISDIVPHADEVDPNMLIFIKGAPLQSHADFRTIKHNYCVSAVASFNWDQSTDDFEVYSARSLPRLPNPSDYPILKVVDTAPTYLQLY